LWTICGWRAVLWRQAVPPAQRFILLEPRFLGSAVRFLDETTRFVGASSIQTGAWSLAPALPRTARSTPAD
jgi:hypothetical protein